MDRVEHIEGMLHDIEIRKANDAVAAFLKPSGTPRIVTHLHFVEMVASVEFDDELCRHAVKIRDERANRMLSAEAEAGEAFLAQERPQLTLVFVHLLAELSSTFVRQRTPPSAPPANRACIRSERELFRRDLQAGHLPPKGEGLSLTATPDIPPRRRRGIGCSPRGFSRPPRRTGTAGMRTAGPWSPVRRCATASTRTPPRRPAAA